MNKLLIAILLATSSATAHAGYEQDFKVKKLCEGHGNVSRDAYKAKVNGVLYDEHIAKIGKNSASEMMATVGYESKAEQDAYDLAWAKCMDVFSKSGINF